MIQLRFNIWHFLVFFPLVCGIEAQADFKIDLKCFLFKYPEGLALDSAKVTVSANGHQFHAEPLGNHYHLKTPLAGRPTRALLVKIVPPDGYVSREFRINPPIGEARGMDLELRVYLVRKDFKITTRTLDEAARYLDSGSISKSLAPLEFAHQQQQFRILCSTLKIFVRYRYASALQRICLTRDYDTCDEAETLLGALETLHHSPEEADAFHDAKIDIERIQKDLADIREHREIRYEESLVKRHRVAARAQFDGNEQCRIAVEKFNAIWSSYEENRKVWSDNGVPKWRIAIDLGKSALCYAEYVGSKTKDFERHEVYEYLAKGLYFLSIGVDLRGIRNVDGGAIAKGNRIKSKLENEGYSFNEKERAKWKLEALGDKGVLRIRLPAGLDKGQEEILKAEILRLHQHQQKPEQTDQNRWVECEIDTTETMELSITSSDKLKMTPNGRTETKTSWLLDLESRGERAWQCRASVIPNRSRSDCRHNEW